MWFFLTGGADASEIKENCVAGLKRGCYTDCRACRGRKQMNAIKDSRNVERNSGAVQKCCEPLSLLFLREPFQVIQCSQGEAANCALDLANPSHRVSHLLRAWSSQKGKEAGWRDGSSKSQCASRPEWRQWRSTLMLHFEVTSAHPALSLCAWGVLSCFEGYFNFYPLKSVQILNSGWLQVKPQMSESALQILHRDTLHKFSSWRVCLQNISEGVRV